MQRAPCDYQSWYEKTYPELHQNGLWLRGRELNTLPIGEYTNRSLRALFVRLSTYEDTGYSFTHQYLYQIAAGTPGVYPDLAYLPPRRDVAIFERDRVPWLLGTQSKRGPEGFDLIGFSNSIVQEMINVPSFLSRSKIPLSKRERMERADIPLVILGGANALYSSALWLDEPLVDGIFIGESDLALRRILEICRDGKLAGRSKQETLVALEEVQGFVQPDRSRSIRKNFALDLNKSEALEKGPICYLADTFGSAQLQISEGCPCFCSFCAESWERRPYRERKAAVLLENALQAKASMGLDSIDLYSFNFNLHSDLYSILWTLAPYFRQIGLKSQRFDLLAHDPEMLRFQQALGKTSLTCGLEGISPRLRQYLHKNLESEELHQSMNMIFKAGARELKVFLIATGLEEAGDFAAFDDLLDHISTIRRAAGAGTRMIFSMTPLVRFPWTPMEFEDAYPITHYERIVRQVAGRVRAAGFEFREAADLPEYWVSQILVRADQPGLARALWQAIAETGFIYYRDVPVTFMAALEAGLEREGLDPAELLKGFDLDVSRTKPWAGLETGVKREFVWERALLARSFKEVDYCLGRAWTKAKCSHCGGCPTRFHVQAIVLAKQKREYSFDQFKERLRQARITERPVKFLVNVGPRGRGVPRKLVAVALARALMLSVPALTPYYRGFTGSFWSDEERPVWVLGEDCLGLVWHEAALPILGDLMKNPQSLRVLAQHLGEWAVLIGLTAENWAPERLVISSPGEPRLDAYLKSKGLKHTLHKRPDGSYDYEMTAQSVKKGFMKQLSRRKDPAAPHTTQSEIHLGPKFDLPEFTKEALSSRGSALIRIESFGPKDPLSSL